MIGFASFFVSIGCFGFAVFLLTPYGQPILNWMANDLAFRRGLWIVIFINSAVASYLSYFIYSLRSADRIWLINIFLGYSMMLSGTGLAAFDVSFSTPIGDNGLLTVGGENLTNLVVIIMGYKLHKFSALRYKNVQKH